MSDILLVKNVLEKKKYRYFEDELNIIGVRNTDNPNMFDDILYLIYKDSISKYTISTDPGFKSLIKPLTSKGCAILVPNQYIDCWSLGLHKGKYEALVQVKPVTVYRDNNKDKILDLKNPETGLFGINIHRANPDMPSTYVEDWSAGCQVFKDPQEYKTFIQLCKLHQTFDKLFTYTLLEHKDFI